MPPVTPIVRYLLILNALVFAVVVLPREVMGYPLQLEQALAMYYPASSSFRPYQIITHFFMHADIGHIGMNMLGLYFLGPLIETRLGATKFIILYFLSAMGSVGLHIGEMWLSIQHYEGLLATFTANPSLQHLNEFFAGVDTSQIEDNGASVSMLVGNLQNKLAMNTGGASAINEARSLMQGYVEFLQKGPMVGASGAISGVLASFAVFYPWQKLQLLFVPVGIPAVYFVSLIFLIDLFLGFADFGFDRIAHFAHIGGGITGAVLAFIWLKTSTPPWMKRVDKGA
ncbi:MAG: membrane associated rhomboid family serine protease [Neolewinella sp.]|jgi:membrane associated rhomboid family serine protease